MNLYAQSRPGLFILFAPSVLLTFLLLLGPTLMGLLIIVPGLLGLAGLLGLLWAWGGMVLPALVRDRLRSPLIALLVCGLLAATLGGPLLLDWSQKDGLLWSVGLGGACWSYAAIAGFFLVQLASAARARGTAELGFETRLVAVLVATLAGIVPAVVIGSLATGRNASGPQPLHYVYFAPYVLIAAATVFAIVLRRAGRMQIAARVLLLVTGTGVVSAALLLALAHAQQAWHRDALARGEYSVVEQALQEARAANPFAQAFCAGRIDAAAALAKAPEHVGDPALLARLVRDCLVPGSPPALDIAREAVMLDALLAHRQRMASKGVKLAPCTEPFLGFLVRLYAARRIDSLRALRNAGVAIDCDDPQISSPRRTPAWWRVRYRGALDDGVLRDLQSLGIDLKARDEWGAQILDGHNSAEMSDRALLHLVESGLDLDPASDWAPHLSVELMFRRYSNPPDRDPETLDRLLQRIGEPTLAQLEHAAAQRAVIQRAQAFERAGGDRGGLLDYLVKRGVSTALVQRWRGDSPAPPP